MFPQTPHIECVALLESGVSRGFGVAAGLDPDGGAAAGRPLRELGYDSIWSNDHPGAKGLETLAEFGAAAPEHRPRRRRDRPRPHPAGGDRRRSGAPRPRPGPPLAGGRRRLLGEAAEQDARVPPRAARAAAGGAPRPRRDGAEDVRAGRRRVRRCLLQLDDAGLRRRRPRQRSRPAPARPAARRPRSSATCAPRVGPDAAERLAKEESFYRDLHDGYRNHFARLGEPEGTVGVAGADAAAAQSRPRRLHRPRHHRRQRPRQRQDRADDRASGVRRTLRAAAP